MGDGSSANFWQRHLRMVTLTNFVSNGGGCNVISWNSLKSHDNLRELAVCSEQLESRSRILPACVVGMREKTGRKDNASRESEAITPGLAEREEPRPEFSQDRNEPELPDRESFRLIANLVHDLRTPLVCIRGYIKMVLDERAGSINGTQREYLTIVAENTDQVIQLLKNALEFIESEPPHFERFDLCYLWKDILVEARPLCREKFLQITERAPATPLVIFGYRPKLKEVFTKLLFNAIKVTDQGGEIIVELSSNKEGEATVKIFGTGVGIPAELLDTGLSREMSSGNGSSNIRDSLRAGLTMVQDIIRSHGGHLSVLSKTGSGVTVLITLPAV
jgi:signal transduction histidine kinase